MELAALVNNSAAEGAVAKRKCRRPPRQRRPPYDAHKSNLTMQGRSLEEQLEAAAGGRLEGLLGVVAEAVVLQAATGRGKREGARTSRHPPVGQREGVAAVHAACGDMGRIGGLSVCRALQRAPPPSAAEAREAPP